MKFRFTLSKTITKDNSVVFRVFDTDTKGLVLDEVRLGPFINSQQARDCYDGVNYLVDGFLQLLFPDIEITHVEIGGY